MCDAPCVPIHGDCPQVFGVAAPTLRNPVWGAIQNHSTLHELASGTSCFSPSVKKPFTYTVTCYEESEPTILCVSQDSTSDSLPTVEQSGTRCEVGRLCAVLKRLTARSDITRAMIIARYEATNFFFLFVFSAIFQAAAWMYERKHIFIDGESNTNTFAGASRLTLTLH